MILTKFIFHFLDSRNEQIDLYASKYASIQANQLKYLIKQAQNTLIGNKYGFENCKDHASFT
ncbi:MAG: GH3 family domain-containing protein, partial [Bacteroidales bacterium]